eukprot:TRINITY_DN916_c0_g1_i1.p1 TRINITY_DN916_c0_g1~~TRINITY_DN916_c0_g1_i1.p1  ORF type:complete len:292 (-),score=30.12 TRINITY_DN916_c0_g1_i1:5-880(-)
MEGRPLLVILLVCAALSTLSQAQFPSQWDSAPMAHDNLPEPVIHHTPLNHKNTGLNVTGNVMRVTNPKKFFNVYPPINGCPSFSRVSDTAKVHNCVLATNGGFFNTKTGDCLGNLVSEGKVLNVGQERKANFGTVNGNFAIGYINHETLKKHKFDNLIAGVGWLVRDGKQFVNQSLVLESMGTQFAKFHAPRLSIGYTSSGELLIVEVNGLESIDAGVSLWELADIAIRFGAVSAINLDGGGSVTVVHDDKILNTCSDKCAGGSNDPYMCPLSPGRCERAVTSITCIKHGK